LEEKLLTLFEQISAIPRPSGSEERIGHYLLAFAHRCGLASVRDAFHNVVIEKKAAAGRENDPGIFVQAHMDMVCEKNSDSSHDFEKDAIQVVRGGDFLSAKGTSLGADNGIGMAMLLRLLEEDFANPRVVAIFTADEERGLGGVKNLDLSPYGDIDVLVNLDSEEEGVFFSSCAGGVRCRLALPVLWARYQKSEDTKQLSIVVKGLSGGHSGLAIDCERANAILFSSLQ